MTSTMAARVGRPFRGGKPQSKNLSVRLTSIEHRSWREAAKLAKLPITEFVRRCVNEVADLDPFVLKNKWPEGRA